MSDVIKYYHALFSGVREYTESPLPLYGRAAKGTVFMTCTPQTPEQAQVNCSSLDVSHDLYSSIGIAPGGHRDVEMSIEMLIGIAVDLDCEGPHRAKTNLFANQTEAIEMLDRLPIRHSLLVNSGHGVQAYWLWKEPWVFSDQEERLQAKGMIQGWIEQVRRHSSRTIDSTYGLNSLFRVPGTLNHKEALPVQTSILAYYEERSNPSDFEPFLVQSSASVFLSSVTLQPTAKIHQRVAALLAMEPEFADLWHHRIHINDESQSGWDWIIAKALVDANLDDETIADALVANREMHSGKRKPPRYYQYTLAKLRAKLPRERESESPPAKEPEEEELPGEAEQLNWYRHLSKTVGVRVALIEVDDPEQTAEDTSYVIHFESGNRLTVKRDAQIRSYKYWAIHIRGKSPVDQMPIPQLHKGEWERIIERLRSHTMSMDQDSHTYEMVSALRNYLLSTSTTVEDLGQVRVTDKRALYKDGYYFFIKEEFSHWYWKIHGKLERTVFVDALRHLGATRRQVGRRGNSYTAVSEDSIGRILQEDVHRGPEGDGGHHAGDSSDDGPQAQPDQGDGLEDRLLHSTDPN